MRFKMLFSEGFQPQHVLISFLFSMKHSYLIMAKMLLQILKIGDISLKDGDITITILQFYF